MGDRSSVGLRNCLRVCHIYLDFTILKIVYANNYGE
jgi:hypothetical protein